MPCGRLRHARSSVILRKNSQSNRGDLGAATQAVLMSVYRTLKLRGLNPTKTIADAPKTYLTTGELPLLPPVNHCKWLTSYGVAKTASRPLRFHRVRYARVVPYA